MHNDFQKGFSLVELLLTTSLVVVLAAMGMATFSLYQKRAYNTTALQVGIQLRKAVEAGMATRSSSASTLFEENRSLVFDIDGTLRCVSGCSGVNLGEIFPGFNPQNGIKLVILISTSPSLTIQAGHCKSLTDGSEHYDGWIISDQDASIRVAIPVVAEEVAQCSEVLGGVQLDDVEEPTPTPPVVACGNGTVEGAEACDDGNTSSADGCSASCTDECGGACSFTCLQAGGNFSGGTPTCNYIAPGMCMQTYENCECDTSFSAAIGSCPMGSNNPMGMVMCSNYVNTGNMCVCNIPPGSEAYGSPNYSFPFSTLNFAMCG